MASSKTLGEKLNKLRQEAADRKIHVMIIGPGSVGMYLLDYLMSAGDPDILVTVAGRNREKMERDVNIVRVSSAIRGQNRTEVRITDGIDLEDIPSITQCLRECGPDIIVNSSRVYAGLKYGSISWKNVRAYGIWAPLAVRYIKNIMEAYEEVDSDAIVINTSYSDAVIPWLKSAGKSYPDFGSGNINHLIPRIRFAVAGKKGIEDHWNIDVTYAASHFHDVVISKEGQTEGVEQLIDVRYRGEKLVLDMDEIFSLCRIRMPVDAKRNMMNASSNYEIIKGILSAVRDGGRVKLHCPGIFGEIGGYPVILDGTGEKLAAYIDESRFSLGDMRGKNRESIYLDGIEDVKDGVLSYTEELREKAAAAFGVALPKSIPLTESGEVADYIVNNVIKPFSVCAE